MRFPKKLIFALVLCLFSAALLTLIAGATESEEVVYPTEGYVYNTEGKETNIKWTITEEDGLNVCRFEIDKNATDKVQTTVVTACDATGASAGYSTNKIVPWYYYGKVNKMIFGEGITEAKGGVYMVISQIKTIEVSKDFKKTGFATFEVNSGLNTFMVTGNEYVEGLGDFTYMSEIGSYCFDGDKFTDIILGENIKSIPTECFKSNKLSEVNIPANIQSISGKAFASNASLKKVTFHNPSVKISDTAFDNCVQFFTIVGYKDSTAQTFAEAGGYEFVDIETGEVLIAGTRVVEKDPNEIMDQYPLESADAKGLLNQLYNNSVIVNTYWAYFKDSKTMVFKNNGSGYNETGNQNSPSEDAQRYSEFKFEVEHIIVGPGIHKISGRAFEGFSALKTVQFSGSLQKIDQYAFHNCTSLTTMYKLGKNPEEGIADLTLLGQCDSGIIKNTAIQTVKLKNTIDVSKINPIAFIGCKNIMATVSDAMIEYVQANLFNLINIENPEEVYEYYQYINPDTVSCGSSSIASFDESTGTLTILGSGALNDIVNYYGGGSKKQPWFSFRNDIKKIVIGPRITSIGKYNFTQCINLQELELPASPIEIGAGAFEKCYNLRSVYITGNEPVLGTFDLSTISNIEAWTFAYNYLAVNPIINENVAEIGSSVFEDCMNLETVYGVLGSYAETYASEMGLGFKDISAETPVAKLGTPPDMNQDEKERAERNQNKDEETEPVETELAKYCIVIGNPPEGYTQESLEIETEIVTYPGDDSGSPIILIIAVAAGVIVIAAAAVIVIAKSRKEKK